MYSLNIQGFGHVTFSGQWLPLMFREMRNINI